MAWPKVLNEIKAQLDRIEARLDAVAPAPTALQENTLPETHEAEAARYAESIDYDSYTVMEIRERVGGLTQYQRSLLWVYETSHKNRKMAVEVLETAE